MHLKPALARDERLSYKQAMVELASQQNFTFAVHASPNGDVTSSRLESMLRAWVAKVDRHYLGRGWLRNPAARMQGIAFFEVGPFRAHDHAHLMVTPPIGANLDEFANRASAWWGPSSEAYKFGSRPVTRHGHMLVQRLAATPDLRRMANYETKEFERGTSAIERWKFLEGLSAG